MPPQADNDMCKPTGKDTFAIYRVIGNDLPVSVLDTAHKMTCNDAQISARRTEDDS